MFQSKSDPMDEIRRFSVDFLEIQNAFDIIFEFAVDQQGLWDVSVLSGRKNVCHRLE